jgi:hypothetical protein
MQHVDPLLSKDLKTTKHVLLGSRVLISTYIQPLLSNAFANKYVPTETIGVQE